MDMTLDVTQVLADMDGKPMMEPRQVFDDDGKPVLDAEGKPTVERVAVTLRMVCQNCLAAQLETDKGMSGEDKIAIYSLSLKIHKEDRPVLDAKEVVLLKARVGMAFVPAIVGPAFLLLNGTPSTPKLAETKR